MDKVEENKVETTEAKSTEKKKLTDEERIALATKLDKELDDFISGLEKKTNSLNNEDADWHKDMENHPFFLKTVPENGEVSPLVEGLQQLKYSTEENTPDELANSYKEDGNFNFKCKNYRMAIISYTEGLAQKFSNPELRAQLLNNRAAAHWQLKNFRSCYNDCKAALKEVPIYLKSKKRLAQTCFELKLWDECVDLCDEILHVGVDDQVSTLRVNALKEKNVWERNNRKEQTQQKKKNLRKEKLKKMIMERGIRFVGKPCWELPKDGITHGVQIEGDHLTWPVVTIYPEYKTCDIIHSFHENVTFQEQFDVIFQEPPEWDVDHQYNPSSIIVHYEDIDGKIHFVKKSSTLGSVLKEPHFRVEGSTASFIIFAQHTKAYKNFMSKYTT